MSITALPTPPSRSDASDVFVSRADAFLAALPAFATEANALQADVNTKAAAVDDAAAVAVPAAQAAAAATAYCATSSSILALSTGGKTVVLNESGKAFADQDDILLVRKGDASMRMTAQVSGAPSGLSLPVTVTSFTGSGGPYSDWIVIHRAFALVTAGKHALWIPASALTPRTTNGAAGGAAESTTNKVMQRTLDFDASTVEYAQYLWRPPKSWDEGTLTFAPVWLHGAASTNFKVSWGLRAVAVSDGEPIDAAFGTAQFSNDTGGTAGTLYVGPESAAITVAGSPSAEDVVVLEIQRKADDATNDTLAVDAKLLGFTLYLRTNAETDA